MLRKLNIKNFKLWKDTGDLKLAPITIFFGPNSSGKSSLIQLLLMLKQTAMSMDMNTVLDFGNGKSLVRLGTYYDIINNHDTNLNLKFGLEWDFENYLQIDGKSRFLNEMNLNCEIRLTGEKPYRLSVQEMAYRFKTHESFEGLFNIKRHQDKPEEDTYTLNSEYIDKKNAETKEKIAGTPPPAKFYRFPSPVYFVYPFLQSFITSLEETLQSLVYVGPLRDYPHPEYTWTGNVPETVGIRGERAMEAILAGMMGANGDISGSYYKNFKTKIEHWLKTMELADIFKFKDMDDMGSRFSFRISTPDGKCEVDLTQVGFGFSQILPVIVQSYYASPGSTVIFEQPEIHMHPKIQADLADLFIDAAKTNNVQFLIESHSEHLLRRLQRRIAEEQISPEDVIIYFCTNTKDGAKIEELKTDEFGNISNWPDNFFGDRQGDIMARTREEIRRKIGEEE